MSGSGASEVELWEVLTVIREALERAGIMPEDVRIELDLNVHRDMRTEGELIARVRGTTSEQPGSAGSVHVVLSWRPHQGSTGRDVQIGNADLGSLEGFGPPGPPLGGEEDEL